MCWGEADWLIEDLPTFAGVFLLRITAGIVAPRPRDLIRRKLLSYPEGSQKITDCARSIGSARKLVARTAIEQRNMSRYAFP